MAKVSGYEWKDRLDVVVLNRRSRRSFFSLERLGVPRAFGLHKEYHYNITKPHFGLITPRLMLLHLNVP
jgi:hypothetical protein